MYAFVHNARIQKAIIVQLDSIHLYRPNERPQPTMTADRSNSLE